MAVTHEELRNIIYRIELKIKELDEELDIVTEQMKTLKKKDYVMDLRGF